MVYSAIFSFDTFKGEREIYIVKVTVVDDNDNYDYHDDGYQLDR